MKARYINSPSHRKAEKSRGEKVVLLTAGILLWFAVIVSAWLQS